LITPAELETRLYSNRFAAHVLRYQQAYALFRERGWTANYLGPYDGGYEGQARRDFPGAGLTAYFDHYPVDAGPFAYPVDLCSTDRVSFCRTGDRRRAPVPLEEVPELVFSEAMRDVDLFVSITSIALDPRWADRGEDPHSAYWREYSFGDLTETAVVRGEALARLVPKLKIAPRLELTGRYLRVQGRLNSYKIHIGSGNVLIEPDDRYLCIVPAQGDETRIAPARIRHLILQALPDDLDDSLQVASDHGQAAHGAGPPGGRMFPVPRDVVNLDVEVTWPRSRPGPQFGDEHRADSARVLPSARALTARAAASSRSLSSCFRREMRRACSPPGHLHDASHFLSETWASAVSGHEV
jgi:hypothetical protein